MGGSRRLVAGLVALALVGGALALGSVGGCSPSAGDHPSVVRAWNEANLDAIRRDFPSPVVHARNLWHSSAAMWDAWAAFDDTAVGYFADEEASGSQRDREVAISHAAHGVLRHRYADTSGSEDSLAAFGALMRRLCLDPSDGRASGDDPVALGNRIADRIIEFGRTDGSFEDDDYIDPDYEPVNPPLDPRRSGTLLNDPNRWQPLDLDQSIGQNGIPLEEGVQDFVGPHWGGVTSFALPDGGDDRMPIDPGPPPQFDESAFARDAVEVLRFSALLDPRQADAVDISPATLGANPLGTYDGDGHDRNPVTGSPYEPNEVNEADFGRVVAEFWADGPDSETPPGHWNTLANTVSDELRADDSTEARLAWDVQLAFTLNAGMHDAAVAAWGTKGFYDYVRPISMIRHLGQQGQRSDPDGPSYDPNGLPLEDGLIEVATEETIQDSGRHENAEALAGEVVVRTWAGNPASPEFGLGGVDWIRAADWVPYQLPTFVTPSFAGYVSGHSTFSRAAAEVLTGLTGSEFFPDGLGEWTIEADDLEFEVGPDEPVTLQWATYADAADQAGVSRLYGGIHVRADDLEGRRIGAEVGQQVLDLAGLYLAGEAQPVL